jgi:hypothetical protein
MTDPYAKLRSVMEQLSDATAIFADDLVRVLGWEDEPEAPQFLLTDEERDAIEQRAFGRTLQEIDELETVR